MLKYWGLSMKNANFRLSCHINSWLDARPVIILSSFTSKTASTRREKNIFPVVTDEVNWTWMLKSDGRHGHNIMCGVHIAK